MVRWLEGVRMLRADSDAAGDLLEELFKAGAAKFACPKCQVVGLAVEETRDDWEDEPVAGWPCENCGRMIPGERLEIFPDTRLCVACQGGEESGQSTAEPEYCPRCGAVMALKKSTSGITRYAMSCPKCRR
jgi:DNA-directed RNA polymerase subunit M/transcription elongation factor TFIIS